MGHWFGRLLGTVLAGLLVACGSGSSQDTELRGQILVWHGWTGAEAAVLDQLFEQFTTIYPQVTVIHESIPPNILGEEFIDKATVGAGPDLLIVPAKWEQPLADAGVIQDLSDRNLDTSVYLSSAVNQLRYRGRLYALPLSLHVYALYYNKTMVSSPPATLPELLVQAAEGKQMALDTSFYGAFWGIQAFGGQLFDEQGRVALDQGGFAEWLAWLNQAQAEPSIIMSNNEQTLYTLFRQGRVAYYVGGPDRLADLRQALGEETIGVAPLPGGPQQPAGPFLQAEALMFNASSTQTQTELALNLARFLTNEEQQTKLALQAGRIPANARVRINPRVSPAVAGFAAQVKTAVPIPNSLHTFDVIFEGDKFYVQTLEGILEPKDAARQFTEQVNTRYGLIEGSHDVE